jgi:hypothetical protein
MAFWPGRDAGDTAERRLRDGLFYRLDLFSGFSTSLRGNGQ